jgi:predicted dehydrogenase
LGKGDNSMNDMLRIGIFGVNRGHSYINILKNFQNAGVTAVCDKNINTLESVKADCNSNTKYFTDFDEFIESGIDAVILCNYFNEHTYYAIKAMEKGIHVLSETASNSTMAEGAALCRAVEKSESKNLVLLGYPLSIINHVLYSKAILTKVNVLLALRYRERWASVPPPREVK